ncbi:MAG: PilZ domain-containing protein [Archangiaceae bacterium]|nr:PilZ domain-containing protein [Archangiaceae bacterium]
MSAHLRRRPLRIAVALAAAELAPWLERLEALGHQARGCAPDAVPDGEHDVLVGRLDPKLRALKHRLKVPALIHLGTLSPELLEAWVDEARLTAAEDLEQVVACLDQLASPERRQQRFIPAPELQVRVGPEGASFAVHDISDDGVAFRVPFGASLDAFTRDALLKALTLERGRAVHRLPVAQVKNLSAHADGYRVGCQLLPQAEPGARRCRVDVQGLVALLLRKGVARHISVRQLDAPYQRCAAALTTVRFEKGTLCLSASDRRFAVHDVVECQFDTAGATYAFYSVVLENQPLTLTLPRTLTQTTRRAAVRLGTYQPLELKLRHPLTGQPLTLPVRDLSGRGLGFDFDPRECCFPPGLKLEGVDLELDGEQVSVSAEVRTVRPEGPGQSRCGARFFGLLPAAQAQLGSWCVRLELHGRPSRGPTGFPALWQFFCDTRLIDPPTAQALRPALTEISHTFEQLSAESSRIAQHATVSDGDGIVAHVEAVLRFRHTWFIQHLAARRSAASLALLLNRAFAEFVEQRPGIRFARLTYFARNRWPARILGRFARRIEADDFSVLQPRHIFTVPSSFAAAPEGAELEVREAEADALSWVERFFTRVEPCLLWQANDLSARHLTLSEVNAAYREAGLSRSRVVLVAHRRGERVGVALAELSSLGVNLREDFSGLRLWPEPSLPADEQAAVMAALLTAGAALYRSHERAAVKLFAEPAQRAALEALGLAPPVEVREWTFRREAVPAFVDYTTQLLARLGHEPEP